jgi:hypothetical protein
MPHLAKLGETATSIWNSGSKALTAGLSYAKSWVEPVTVTAPVPYRTKEVHENMEGVPMLSDTGGGNDEEQGEGEPIQRGLWGEFACCIGCVSGQYGK